MLANAQAESTRITPAYAGKSGIYAGNGVVIQDHPRLRGEKVPAATAANADQRITPAYAGKSTKITKLCNAVQDHPRLRGEKHCGG